MNSGAGDRAGCLLAPCCCTADVEKLQLVQFNCTTETGLITPTVLGNNSTAHMLLCFWGTQWFVGCYAEFFHSTYEHSEFKEPSDFYYRKKVLFGG